MKPFGLQTVENRIVRQMVSERNGGGLSMADRHFFPSFVYTLLVDPEEQKEQKEQRDKNEKKSASSKNSPSGPNFGDLMKTYFGDDYIPKVSEVG